jgi:hypothetical protein
LTDAYQAIIISCILYDGHKQVGITEGIMDPIIQSVYRQMLQTHHCSVDVILESPELRNEYLTAVRASLGNLSEQVLLHRLTVLRKQSKLPRRDDANQDCNNLFGVS